MMLLLRFRSFKIFIPMFVLWIACHIFIVSYCCATKDEEQVRAHTASEPQKIPNTGFLRCFSRGGTLNLLVFKNEECLLKKSVANTYTEICLPSDFEIVIFQWSDTTEFRVEVGDLRLEAKGPQGVVALQRDARSGSLMVKASHNLLSDPRCFIIINGTPCKDPSIKYFAA